MNDQEICDDEAFVAQSGVFALVCLNTNGGVAYAATNTGPPDVDGTPRCQGWEHASPPQPLGLNYLAKLDCTPGGPGYITGDLSAFAGQKLWFGVHDQPGGGGHNTSACLALAKGTPSCEGHCQNGAQDCGEQGVDCGGECAACPATGYQYSDCKSHEAVSNGSEDCDDTWLDVEPPGTQYVLVCFNHNGGVAYASTNTGPVMSDGVARCQGWEEMGVWAGEQLDYLAKMTCDSDQKTLPLDLSAWVGKSVHMGSHTQPDGSGHGTVTCIAQAK